MIKLSEKGVFLASNNEIIAEEHFTGEIKKEEAKKGTIAWSILSSHCAWCHCGTPDTTLSYCAPAGDWHIDIGLNDWCLAVLFYRQRASSDNCCLIRGHVHHDVYRYQHQRTHKGKCRTTGFVIIRLAEHSASNIRLLAMRLNE